MKSEGEHIREQLVRGPFEVSRAGLDIAVYALGALILIAAVAAVNGFKESMGIDDD